MKKIILDTDIDTDCDDAGALAVLHTLANRGEAEILGVICSVPVQWCVPCVKAVNGWYDRPDIPVGAVDEGIWEGSSSGDRYMQHRRSLGEKGMLYNELIGRAWLATNATSPATDAVRLYRQLLARQADASVTICAIGTLTAVAGLLGSGPDDISDMPGHELVARKVQSLVSMAIASYPAGRDGFNWRTDLQSAAMVIRECPVHLAVQPGGGDVLTGARFMANVSPDHPVSTAYRTWLQSDQKNRSSWDQLTALYAVRGKRDVFSERTGLTLTLDENSGSHEWDSSTGVGPARTLIEPAVDSAVLATMVEDLMIGVVS